MKFTFGICSTGGNEGHILNFIKSVEDNKIPTDNYEILVVGDLNNQYFGQNKNVKVIPFDESLQPGWITRKKNLITEYALYDNIVFLHDYLILKNSWYDSMCKFGDAWDVLVTRIENNNGMRFRDWVLLGNGRKNCKKIQIKNLNVNVDPYNPFIEVNHPDSKALLPYDETRFSKWIYVSGAYWLAKKKFMIENPLNEDLSWGESEDIEWSIRVRKKTKIKFAKSPTVKINKPGKIAIYSECSKKFLDEIYFKIYNYYDKLPEQDVSLDGKLSEELKKII